MQKVLTDALIKSVPAPAAGRAEIADMRSAGLSFRVTANGAKSWTFRFRDPVSGVSTRYTIGKYPDIGLAKARSEADRLRARVAAGENPAISKRQERETAPTKTINALADRYLAEYARRRKRSHKKDEQNLQVHVRPKWGTRPYASITRGDVIELLEGIVAAGSPIAANRVQSLISGMFGFAIDAGLLSANPCTRLKKRSEEKTRDRVLSDAELREFWNGAVERPVSRRIGLGLRLALLTGCRVGEVAGMALSEIENLHDAANAGWLIPADRVKNKRAHYVPLSRQAREIVLELAKSVGTTGGNLFPTRSGDGAIRGHTLTQAMANLVAHLGSAKRHGASWAHNPATAHDLRRTVETRMSAIGISKEDRDAVLNHAPAGIGKKHYDRYDRATEKRRALNLWGNALAAILDNREAAVIPFNKRGARRG